jgi:hypothetical protein
VDSRLRGNDSFSSSWVCDALIFAHLLITTLSADRLWIPAFAGMTVFLLMGVCDAFIFARKLIPIKKSEPAGV